MLAAGLLISPSAAYAHLVNSGLGPFYDGALHLLLSPVDLLALIAITLLAGSGGARAGRWTAVVLPLAWLIAGFIGLESGAGLESTWFSVISLLVFGGLVASGSQLAPAVVATLAALYGAANGLLNGSALASLGAGFVSLMGSAATVMLVTLLGAAYVVSLRSAWTRVVVRVAGSWVAAIGILMLGWTIQGAG
jgi:hydrogenase/urease accessory protein HupE